MKLYVVRNQEGKYFRAKGYGGYGDSWVPDLEKAKFYAKIGPARSICTFWGGHYPKFGVPVIVEFTIDAANGVVVDQTERVQKVMDKREADRIAEKQREFEYERKQIDAELERLTKLKQQRQSQGWNYVR